MLQVLIGPDVVAVRVREVGRGLGKPGPGRLHLHLRPGGAHDLLLEEGRHHDGCRPGVLEVADGVEISAEGAGAADDRIFELESEIGGLEVHGVLPQLVSASASEP